jgi:acetamidase/formamidase
MKKISSVIHQAGPEQKSCATVVPGEIFSITLQNSFGKSFNNVNEFEQFMDPENEMERRAIKYPCAGPIEVLTEQENISLAIRIIDLKVTRGYQCISMESGIMQGLTTDRLCQIYDVNDDQVLHFKNNDLIMRGSPKLGFITTMGDHISSFDCLSKNGGKIDLNFIDKGSVVYLPVNAPVPRLIFGELHICQGNGEVGGYAVEADGEITVQVSVVSKINFPIIDHKHYLTVVGCGNTIQEAIQSSTENTIKFLQRIFPFSDWSEGELYKFISAEGNLTLGNSTGPVKSCGTVFFKKRLTNKYNFPVL